MWCQRVKAMVKLPLLCFYSPVFAKTYLAGSKGSKRGGGSTQTLNTPSISHPGKCRHSPFKSEWKPPLLPSPPGISTLYLFPFVSNAFVNSSTKVKANNPLQTLGVTATSMNPSQLSSPAAQCLSRLLSFTTVSTKGWNPITRWVNTTTVNPPEKEMLFSCFTASANMQNNSVR